MLPFEVVARDPSGARAGVLETPHGVVHTPAFMPVGTAGTVKGLASWELHRLRPEMVLANTYHLLLRPGPDVVRAVGGLHRLMAWDRPVLTDSGGFQVYSLAGARRVDDDGVTFRSHLDGSEHRLTPRRAIELQAGFAVDVAMVLDECVGLPASSDRLRQAMQRSLRWADLGLEHAAELRAERSWRGGLFAIQQGGLDADLRAECSAQLAESPFDGYAVGGLAVGESRDELHAAVSEFAPLLPSSRPRYLMGVGYPENLLHAVAAGVDLFDCVLPTRSARTGKLFTSCGELMIKHAAYRADTRPLDPSCSCPTCQHYSRAVLRHLFLANEATSVVLLTVHNLSFFVSLMRGAREAIMAGRYAEYRARCELSRSLGPSPDGPTQ